MNTLPDVIERFNKKHEYVYDYSLVEYTTVHTYVKIICKKHGVFLQTPNAHFRGQGCPVCGGTKRLDINIFITRSNKTHNYKYDYSKFIYIKNSVNGIIICPIHGEFKQSSGNHLNGNGCRKCGTINTVDKQKGNILIFIEKANKIHNYKYDYSKFIYINSITKGIIICPIHGEFTQDQNKHIGGKYGCSKCGDISASIKLRGNISEFIEKSNKIHNYKYDYSKFIYINSITLSIIICPIHGEFNQDPAHHLRGRGCSSCSDSIGEKIIRNYLVKYNIIFIPQKKFDDLLNKKQIENYL